MDWGSLVALAVNFAITCIVISFLKSRPILQQNLTDLISCDLAMVYHVTLLAGVVIACVEMLTLEEVIDVYPTGILLVAWAGSVILVVAMLYMTYGAVVTQVYARFNAFSSIEDFSDERVRDVIRLVTVAFSMGVHQVCYLLGGLPRMYLRFKPDVKAWQYDLIADVFGYSPSSPTSC